jgi:hypothetical protein
MEGMALDTWIKIVAVFGGITTILSLVMLLVNLGKKPFVNARNHKTEHAQNLLDHQDIKKQLDTISMDNCKEMARIVSDNRTVMETLMARIQKVQEADQETKILVKDGLERLQMETTIQYNELLGRVKTLFLNDKSLIDGLVLKGFNGPIKERQQELNDMLFTQAFQREEIK